MDTSTNTTRVKKESSNKIANDKRLLHFDHDDVKVLLEKDKRSSEN